MQASEVAASQESRKRERGPTASPVFVSSKQSKTGVEAEYSSSPSSTYPLLTAIATEPAATAFLAAQAAAANKASQASARYGLSLQQDGVFHFKSGEDSLKSDYQSHSTRASSRLVSRKPPRRNSQMYPTLYAATQMAISTIEENECEMNQLTELQYGYCPYWDTPARTAPCVRRYQRRNSCLGSMMLPVVEKMVASADYQYETTDMTAKTHIKFQPLTTATSPPRKIERRNSQTAAMLYVATQMVTIDESCSQLTLLDSKRPGSPSSASGGDETANMFSSSSFSTSTTTSSFPDVFKENPALKKRRVHI